MIDYLLSDKNIYNPILTCELEMYLNNYKKIYKMKWNHYKNIIEERPEYSNIIKLTGISALTNIYLMILISTKNLNATIQHCEKTIFYYFEFIEQMNAPKTDIQAILKLSVYDAKLFIYKKTIYDIIERKHKITKDERSIFINLKNYTLSLIKLTELLINSDKPFNDVLLCLNNMINILPNIIQQNTLDKIINMKNYNEDRLLFIIGGGS